MFAAGLIVFREALEAALIVSIIMAATRGLKGRKRWASLGILCGIACAGVIAALTDYTSSLFDGMGQDIVNASILLIAVLLIGWHVIWMNNHGRQIATDMKRVGDTVTTGEQHLSVIALVIGLAVMREGAEIVLMLQGMWSAGNVHAMIGGASLGLCGGILLGLGIYFGLLRLSIQKIFNSTNALLIMIAAGMAGKAANLLAQADFLPTLAPQLWDSSGFIADNSVAGQLLSGLIGYSAQPSGIEALFYFCTLSAFLGLITRYRRKN